MKRLPHRKSFQIFDGTCRGCGVYLGSNTRACKNHLKTYQAVNHIEFQPIAQPGQRVPFGAERSLVRIQLG